jgi:cysteine-rich repeat protein
MRLSTAALGLLCCLGIILSASCGEQVVVRETEASCGNAQVEVGEACDDGNVDPADACTNSCTIAICGDSVTRSDLAVGEEGFEACDDGNEADTDGCSSACVLAVCGDGLLRADLSEGEPGFERCDDGNSIDTDACLATCVAATCGDGQLRTDLSEGDAGFEACDDGNDDDNDNCLNTCQEASCGDGVVGPGEGCDDGNQDPTDACNACQPASCGDAAVQGGEACDDGNAIDTDACLNNCAAAACGDAVVWQDQEACDDGNQDQNDACLNDCHAASCGDGHLRTGVEFCDDGNQVDGDGCDRDCTNPALGNGADGARVVQGENITLNAYTHLIADAALAARSFTVADRSGFGVGDEVLIIQSQGLTAGRYEFARIEAVAAEQITLSAPLNSAYTSGIFDQVSAEVAQVVRVPQFSDLTIADGASVIAKTWDGRSGGIIVLRAQGAMHIAGSLSAAARGYRDSWGSLSPGQWHHAGEGTRGGSPQQRQGNFGGGGGGYDDNGGFHGGGGGGSHATAGSDGFANASSPSAVGGFGATSVYGSADLTSLFFGGGGSGGRGEGGGIVLLSALSITVTGSVSARGADGHCQHNRWGNGEAGGAGGSIWLRAAQMSLGNDLVQASGGRPGDASWVGGGSGCGGRAGGGGSGRIRLDGNQVDGSTTPVAGHRGHF